MTQYFEVEKRDGAARIGKLMLHQILTPCIINTSELGNIKNPGSIIDVRAFVV